MKSSWSIHDFPSEEVEPEIPKPNPPAKLTEAERFVLIRHRKNRKGRGARRRAGEKRWATKGK